MHDVTIEVITTDPQSDICPLCGRTVEWWGNGRVLGGFAGLGIATLGADQWFPVESLPVDVPFALGRFVRPDGAERWGPIDVLSQRSGYERRPGSYLPHQFLCTGFAKALGQALVPIVEVN